MNEEIMIESVINSLINGRKPSQSLTNSNLIKITKKFENKIQCKIVKMSN